MMLIGNSFELFSALHALDLLQDSPSWWWPNHGEFEVVLTAILTQNTRWESVQKSLQNLYTQHALIPQQCEENLLSLSRSSSLRLSLLIAPSGFANQKAHRLIALAQNILESFGSYEGFTREVSREWLLGQKGIGQESADAILNYACLREIMVVDRYTYRLLHSLGYEMHDYEEIQAWMMGGIEQRWDRIKSLYSFDISLAQFYARFHGKIVEFSKRGLKF